MQHPGTIDATTREVHLWTMPLRGSDEVVARCLPSLSPDELARAERFYFEEHRRRFILGRGALRMLLAGYLGTAAGDLQFAYGPHGKPALADSSCPLQFNTSHSGDLAAYAFTNTCEIGVDVEEHRPVRDLERIADRFFSPEEVGELFALSEVEKSAGFFLCWTRKEAYIKAVGGGLSIPLSSFHVSLSPGAAARMIAINGSEEVARCWTVHDFAPAPNCAGAVVYHDVGRPLRCFPVESAGEVLMQIVK